MRKSIFCFLVVLVAGTNVCWAYPEPAIVQKTSEWTLDVVFDQPQQISVRTSPNGKPQRFWYIILTLTNNSRLDADFYPSCELITDTFKVVPSGVEPQQLVFNKIKQKHQGKYPFLEPIQFTANRILQGQDNAVDVAIIWSDFDSKAKSIDLFIAGLSNETTVIDHPSETDENGNPKKIYLRKTLKLEFAIGGDEKLRSYARLASKSKSWVMR
ncbi:MAG: hypothetical protein JW912_03375 [Sedimentisphaerales bacterium]|nr:hypothetical protein [Sedimentisphaerales bacterium]